MTSRRAIKGVLHNFLGTFTSRNSDFDGYWLFGLLVKDMRQMSVDLLDASGERKATPRAYAEWLAAQRFAEQIGKAGLPKSCLREARLEITKVSDAQHGCSVNGHFCSGYEMRFVAQAVTDLGQTYERALSIFVAPNDPKVELRSARAS